MRGGGVEFKLFIHKKQQKLSHFFLIFHSAAKFSALLSLPFGLFCFACGDTRPTPSLLLLGRLDSLSLYLTMAQQPSSSSSSSAHSSSSANPYVQIVDKRLRVIRKKKAKLESIQATLDAGKKINADQEASLKKKDTVFKINEHLVEIVELMNEHAKADEQLQIQRRKEAVHETATVLLSLFHSHDGPEAITRLRESVFGSHGEASAIKTTDKLLSSSSEEVVPGVTFKDAYQLLTKPKEVPAAAPAAAPAPHIAPAQPQVPSSSPVAESDAAKGKGRKRNNKQKGKSAADSHAEASDAHHASGEVAAIESVKKEAQAVETPAPVEVAPAIEAAPVEDRKPEDHVEPHKDNQGAAEQGHSAAASEGEANGHGAGERPHRGRGNKNWRPRGGRGRGGGGEGRRGEGFHGDRHASGGEGGRGGYDRGRGGRGRGRGRGERQQRQHTSEAPAPQ